MMQTFIISLIFGLNSDASTYTYALTFMLQVVCWSIINFFASSCHVCVF